MTQPPQVPSFSGSQVELGRKTLFFQVFRDFSLVFLGPETLNQLDKSILVLRF